MMLQGPERGVEAAARAYPMAVRRFEPNFEEVAQTVGFLGLDADVPERLLGEDGLGVRREETAYETLVA